MAEATRGQVLSEAIRFLAAHGVTECRLEAEVLLAHLLKLPRHAFYSHSGQALTAAQESQYWQWIKRRGAGEPLAYLTGEREFFSLAFEVSPAVLIPRPETEHVVEAALETLGAAQAAGRAPVFFDVGTGSGAIAVAVLANLPEARGFAGDVSAAALEVARRNARRHGVADRLTLLAGDLFGGFAGTVELVVSNPPYIGEDERDLLPREVRDFEPAPALFGGQDGLTIIRRLIEQSPRHLPPRGRLILEIGYGKDRVVRDLFAADGRWDAIEIRNDLAGIPRVVVGQLGNLS